MDDDRRLGVLAFGDSITNGGGELQWGVALQSWALGLPFTSYATDGAGVAEVAELQLATDRERSAHPEARYDLGCLHIGVNDVRAVDWDPDAFNVHLRTAVDYLAERCDRLVLLTIPLDLGRPRAGAKVEVANAAIETEARRVGATVVDLRSFRGRNVLMADHVHPTALGQIAIAGRVVDALATGGARVFVRPRELVRYETTRTGRLRSDLTYTYRHAKNSCRTVRIRLLGR